MRLYLPPPLCHQLWLYALAQAPDEAVGLLGGQLNTPAEAQASQFYPLENVAQRPQTEYLAHPGQLLRAFRALERDGLTLVALFHSHPRGPSLPSPSDVGQAAYDVPYLIADLSARQLRGFLLPEVREIELMVDGFATLMVDGGGLSCSS